MFCLRIFVMEIILSWKFSSLVDKESVFDFLWSFFRIIFSDIVQVMEI